MFNFMLRGTFYYMVWNKFRSQIITTIVSILLITFIFFIYDDINAILLQKDISYSFELVIAKWSLIFIIIGFNIFSFKKAIKKTKTTDTTDIVLNTEEKSQNFTPKQTKILNKKKLKSKSDLILQKYMEKKDA